MNLAIALPLLVSTLLTSLTQCSEAPNIRNTSADNITYRLAKNSERLHLPRKMELTEFQYIALVENTIVARCCIDIHLKTKNLNVHHLSVAENFRKENIAEKLILYATNDLKTDDE